MVFHFFPLTRLNENKLDERIEKKQPNLNNKTPNKTKTPI